MSTLSRALSATAAVALVFTNAEAQNPPAAAQPPAPMTFFVTSVGKGDGANLGGLPGADAHCAQLADAARVANPARAVLPPGRTWRAYLSGTGADGRVVNARDRIGAGPWHNAKGAIMAASVADLHGDNARDRSQMNKTNALTENATPVNGVGDSPNQHDILTGTDSFGRAPSGTNDTTCSNWTSNAATGSAMVGHSDRTGGGNSSWNSAHASRGCGQPNLVATGGAGLFYCFAAN